MDAQLAAKNTRGLVFKTMPDVLVQDARTGRSFLLPADRIEPFRVKPSDWASLSPNVVTFLIPDEDFSEEVPPFNQFPSENPSVLIQYARGNSAYLLTFEQLETFEVEGPREKGAGYGISFCIPLGFELIEELPALRRAMLQSSEAGMGQ